MHQWFTPEEIKEKQKACPLSIGQAEAGRFTFCIGDQCMAWKWSDDQVKNAKLNILSVSANNIPEGYAPCSDEYGIDNGSGKSDVMVDVMKKPTHGRCGMVS